MDRRHSNPVNPNPSIQAIKYPQKPLSHVTTRPLLTCHPTRSVIICQIGLLHIPNHICKDLEDMTWSDFFDRCVKVTWI